MVRFKSYKLSAEGKINPQMLAIIIIILLSLAVLDTLIGNRIFPGETGVVEDSPKAFSVYKYNRLFFIPVKMWLQQLSYGNTRAILDFTSWSSSKTFDNEKEAIDKARLYANQLPAEETIRKVVWSSKTKKVVDPDRAHELVTQLIAASKVNDDEQEKIILKELELIHKL